MTLNFAMIVEKISQNKGDNHIFSAPASMRILCAVIERLKSSLKYFDAYVEKTKTSQLFFSWNVLFKFVAHAVDRHTDRQKRREMSKPMRSDCSIKSSTTKEAFFPD